MIDFDSAASCKEAAQRIAAAKRVLAVTHMNPDGDAIGSSVAMAHIAAALGKEVRLYCETPIPPNLAWLNAPTPFVASLEELDAWQPDCVVFLDCADELRAGAEMTAYIAAHSQSAASSRETLTICIDHHTGNPHYANCNWVDPAMSATGVMVAQLAAEFGLSLSGDLGEALYLAVVADTGGFSFANTNALALETAATIVKNGLSVGNFTIQYENNWSIDRMRLWGALMHDARVVCNGSVVVSAVTQDCLDEHHAQPNDLEGYASWLRRLQGSKVVILARPARKGGSKVSLRSMNEVDVQNIAAQFGGGGHTGAAGADVNAEPRKAAAMVLEAVCKAMGCSACPAPPLMA